MQEKKDTALGTMPVGRLLFRLSLPAVTAQIVNVLYTVVDRMYIGHMPGVGTMALTGVGVCMPLILLISAFAVLVSMGGAPRASIMMGAGKYEEAEKILGGSALLLALIAAVLTALLLLFGKQLLLLFGASENTISYAWAYMKIYTLGTIFVQLTMGLNAFISAQGFATASMLTVLIGAGLNIALDPLFIFTLGMGVQGAAVATVLSQAVSAVWVVGFLRSDKPVLRLRPQRLRLEARVILPCLALGLSPFVMRSTESILSICFNASLQKYGGDMAVGAMAILSSVMQFGMLPLMGIAQGAQPITSFNYGARNPARVKQAFRLLLISALVYACFIWAVSMFAPEVLVRLFNKEPDFVAYTSWAMRIYMAALLIYGIQIACQQTFIALGNAKASLFLAVLRKVILLIPLIYILPSFMEDKVFAVLLAEPVADILAVLTTATLFTVQFRRAMQALEQEPATAQG